jgi:hypothetical protein
LLIPLFPTLFFFCFVLFFGTRKKRAF